MLIDINNTVYVYAHVCMRVSYISREINHF